MEDPICLAMPTHVKLKRFREAGRVNPFLKQWIRKLDNRRRFPGHPITAGQLRIGCSSFGTDLGAVDVYYLLICTES